MTAHYTPMISSHRTAVEQPPQAVRVLLIEDNGDDAAIVQEYLGDLSGSNSYRLRWVESIAQAQEVLETESFDVALLDFSLPDARGIAALAQCRAAAPSLPIIVLTGLDDEATALQAIREGAQDYLIKGEIDHGRLLQRVLRYAIERKKLFEELEQTRRMALQATAAKSAFLANMSHEIRTPLTAVLGYAELASKSLGDRPKVQQHVDIVRTNGQHLLNLINDILDLSKIEAGKLELDRRECRPIDVLAGVVTTMTVMAVGKGLDLQLDYHGPIPRKICTDPSRLRQALVNLVGNAIKFTDHGSVRLTVELLQDEPEPMLQVQVRDTGTGISQQALERIFEPFCQADSSIVRRFGGTGLGLAITRQVAEALGGRLGVDSTPGQGTCFTLCIATGAVDAEDLIDQPGSEAQSDGASPSGPRYLCGTVLVAEDTIVNQDLIRLVLEDMGLVVETADHGEEAIRKANDHCFDAILMDVQMPGIDGLEATRVLRRQSHKTPIIALTASAMKGTAQRCLDAGCDGYLTKPIDVQDIRQMLSRYLKETACPAAAEPRAAGLAVGDGSLSKRPEHEELELIHWLRKQQQDLFDLFAANNTETIVRAAHALGTATQYWQIDDVCAAAARLERVAAGRAPGNLKEAIRGLSDGIVDVILSVAERRQALQSDICHRTVVNTQAAMKRMRLPPELYFTILQDSLEYLKQQVHKLQEVVTVGDTSQISSISHAMASNAGNIGMDEVLSTARHLEHVAGGCEPGDVAEEFDQLKDQLAEACEYGSLLVEQQRS